MMRISTGELRFQGWESHLTRVIWIDEIVQKLLLQREELVMCEVSLACPWASEYASGSLVGLPRPAKRPKRYSTISSLP